MKKLFIVGIATILAACESLNPFASGVVIEEAPQFANTIDVKTAWQGNVGESGKNILRLAILSKSVVAASAKGEIKAFDKANGNVLWEKNLVDTVISAGVGGDEELIFVGSNKGEVFAFSAEKGEEVWKTKVSSAVVQTPVSTPAGLLVKSADERIFLLNRQNGERLWFYQHSIPTLQVRDSAMPVFAGGFIFAGFEGGKLVALSTENGLPVWQGQVAIPKGANELDRLTLVATPLVEGEVLCAAAFQGQVACFNMMQGGLQLWAKKIGSAKALASDHQALFVSEDSGVLYALNKHTGATLWKNEALVTRNPSAAAVGAGSVLVVGDLDGFVYVLDTASGKFLAKIETDRTAILAPIVYNDGKFWLQTEGGRVIALDVL